ncbi:uncharacterized protein CDV56_108835 [Aspergillus thermomutatus]|uniref:Uncharacterized protein n=1 Tax=Aspergillus thermomutatus TaxID=41047 RepID=A0A397HH78_ASPTH|nr:uncharacterized protein CDV56_108835 [Aspergillus thermomutatus]RHZ62317.1 hypothetical protein CDV56_108835 [Aspergillus thermomutatus]
MLSVSAGKPQFRSKHTATTALVLPEWWRNQDAVSWVLQFRKVLESIIYRCGEALQKALLIFEQNDATSDVHHTSLSQFLPKLCVRWKEFSDTKSITTTFLSSSVIYDDFDAMPVCNDPTEKLEKISLTDPEHESLSSEGEDPACLLKDEIVPVPRGINPVDFLMKFSSIVPVITTKKLITDGVNQEAEHQKLIDNALAYKASVQNKLTELTSAIDGFQSAFGRSYYPQTPSTSLIDKVRRVVRRRPLRSLFASFASFDDVQVAPAFQISDGITSEVAPRRVVANIYPFGRPQTFPDSVLCLKVKSEKKKLGDGVKLAKRKAKTSEGTSKRQKQPSSQRSNHSEHSEGPRYVDASEYESEMAGQIKPDDFKPGIIMPTEETLEQFRQHQKVFDNKAYQRENYEEVCKKLNIKNPDNLRMRSMNKGHSVEVLAANCDCGYSQHKVKG